MPGLEAENVVVAGNGAVFVAPEGTLPPVSPPSTVPGVEYINLGYVSEDGVQFSMDRETEEIMAWQSQDPVRVLSTAEPKTLTFELLEFDPESFEVAMNGGTIETTTGITTFTPPAAGSAPVYCMLIDAVDGDALWRWIFPRVQLQGTVEFSLVRSDAVRLPLEFKVLSSTPSWSMLTDAAEWAVV